MSSEPLLHSEPPGALGAQPKISVRTATGNGTILLLALVAVHPIAAAFVAPVDRTDELAVAAVLMSMIAAGVYTQRTKLSFLAIAVWICSLVGTSIAFGENRSIVDVVLQGVLQAKFFAFCAFAVAYVNPREAKRGVMLLFALLLAGAFLNLLAPSQFISIGATDTARTSLLGLPRLSGFQLNPNRLGRTMALVPLLPFAAMYVRKALAYPAIALAGIVVVLTGSRTALALYLLALGFRFLASLKKPGQRRIAIVVVALPLLAAIAAYGLREVRVSAIGSGALVGEEAPIFRAILLIEGAKLAAENFPFGTGLATFATPFADDAGVYERTAIAQTFFLNRGTGLFDNNLASIVGETGLVGLIFVLLLYVVVIDRSLRTQGWMIRVPMALYFFILINFESLLQNAVTSAAFALFLAARCTVRVDENRPMGAQLF